MRHSSYVTAGMYSIVTSHLQLKQFLSRLLSFRFVADFLSLEFSFRFLFETLRFVPTNITQPSTSQI